VKRILIVRMGAMGDIVHTLPSAATLRHAFPEAEIDWLVDERWSPLLDQNPHVTNVRKLHKRDITSVFRVVTELREHRYDCAIDFQGLMKSAAIAGLAGATQVIGFRMEALREKLAAACYTRTAAVPPDAHVVEQNLALARTAGAADRVIEFPLPTGTEGFAGDYLLISPSAGWAAKRWPPEKFAELIVRVESQIGWPTIVNAGPGEEEIVRKIANVCGTSIRVIQPTLNGLIGAARHARAFIGGDTGPLHIAAAVGTPVVAIFGPTSPQRNGPYAKRVRVVRAPGVSTTYARSASGEDIARVSVDGVYQALVEVTA
jgi:heptosyltransferase-1